VRIRGEWLLMALLACACSRPADKGAPRNASQPAPVAVPAQTAKPTKPSKPAKTGQPDKPSSATAVAPAQPGAEPVKEQPKIEEVTDLKTEEREANPYSETVSLKLTVTPQVKALVMWGGKQMARLEPGKMDAEITRPRGSGPVDLEIKAVGFLPYHTRLHADRNDRVAVRLYRPEEAPNIFGYKRSAEAKQAEADSEKSPRKESSPR